MLRMGKTGGVDSKAEEIRNFDENLAAIIQEAIGNVEEIAVGILGEAGIEILQVAVVTNVDSGTRMEKIGEENVGVEVFSRLERSEIWVGKDGRILTDEAEREFASELVVPFRADDVIVEDAGTLVEAAKAGEQVSVVHGEFSRGAHGEIDLRIAGVGEEGTAKYGRRRGGVEVGVRTPANLAVQGDLLEETGLEEESAIRLESLRSVLIQSVVFHLARAVLDVFPKAGSALVETVVEIGGADERLHGGVPSGAKGNFGINAADTVGADDAAIITAGGVRYGSKLAVGIDETDGGLFADIVIQAKHTEIGFGARERVCRSDGVTRRFIVREEGADGPGTAFAGKA